MIEDLNNYAQLINFVLLLAIIGFLFQLTNTYRSNVKEQTATLEQRMNLLKDQLAEAKAKDALAVAEALNKRVKITEEEIERLQRDNENLTGEVKKQQKDGETVIELIQQMEEMVSEVEKSTKEISQRNSRLNTLIQILGKEFIPMIVFNRNICEDWIKACGYELILQLVGSEKLAELFEQEELAKLSKISKS